MPSCMALKSQPPSFCFLSKLRITSNVYLALRSQSSPQVSFSQETILVTFCCYNTAPETWLFIKKGGYLDTVLKVGGSKWDSLIWWGPPATSQQRRWYLWHKEMMGRNGTWVSVREMKTQRRLLCTVHFYKSGSSHDWPHLLVLLHWQPNYNMGFNRDKTHQSLVPTFLVFPDSVRLPVHLLLWNQFFFLS